MISHQKQSSAPGATTMAWTGAQPAMEQEYKQLNDHDEFRLPCHYCINKIEPIYHKTVEGRGYYTWRQRTDCFFCRGTGLWPAK